MLHYSVDRACEITSYLIFSVKFKELSDPHSGISTRVVGWSGWIGGVGGGGGVFWGEGGGREGSVC